VVPLARLCHLRRVAEACERVTDLFWRRLEGCGGGETYEVEFLHPEGGKSGDGAERLSRDKSCLDSESDSGRSLVPTETRG
jgi:hypothetical protein